MSIHKQKKTLVHEAWMLLRRRKEPGLRKTCQRNDRRYQKYSGDCIQLPAASVTFYSRK